MTPTQAFRVLGMTKTADVAGIRRAYADALKAMDIDRDVDGYARLRNARDSALRWARMQAVAATEEKAFEGVTPPDDAAPPPAEVRESSGWLYSAPEMTGEADPTLTTRLVETAPRLDVTRGFSPAQAPAEQAIAVARDPFARPVLLGLEPSADAVMPAWAHEQALHRLLLPDSDADELPPLEGWEEAMARGHLKAVLHQAETLSVTGFDEVDNWLARLLADAWPRSAPLLEPAAAVFGWEGERGQVTERPAVAFLNARLRGLRFYQKVQEAGHPLHKAWKELTTPAQQGSRKGWFVKRADVEQLLAGVRKNFPELEHHFDHWRVSLWERQGGSADNYGWFSGWRLALFGLIFVVQILRFAIPSGDKDAASTVLPPVATASEQAVLDRAVTTIFGPNVTLDRVREKQPDLAALFSANRTIARSENSGDDAYIGKVRDLVRERMYMTALVQKGSLLTDVQRVRADMLRAARKMGAAQCMAYVRTHRMATEVTVPDTVLEAERKLALRMLDAQQLGPPQRIANGKASVPGELVSKVIDATAIPEARVRQAMGGKGSDADQCSVTIALIDAALGWKGAEKAAILSVL